MSAKRNPSLVPLMLAAIATTVSLATFQECLAAIHGGSDEPLEDFGCPTGCLEVANLKSRLGWWEGGQEGIHVFLYREKDTPAFNEALARFAKIKSRRLLVVIHDGPHEDFWLHDHEKPAGEAQPLARVDWMFTVWEPESWHGIYHAQPVAPPRIDLYIGGGRIDFAQVKMPPRIEVRDERQSASPVKLEKGSALVGRVCDMHTGKVIVAAEVVAIKSVAKPTGGYDVVRLAKTVTDGDGEYQLLNVDPAADSLNVGATGYASRQVGLEPAERPVYRLTDVELSPQAVMTGRVVNESGNPLAGVIVRTTVALAIDGRQYDSPSYRKAETDGEGRFELKDLPTGLAQLSYHKDRYYHTPLGGMQAAPGEPVQVVMVRTGVIRGTVTEAGKPVAGVHVALDQEGKTPGTWSGAGTWHSGSNTDEQGRFEVADAPPGTYRLQAAGQTEIIILRGGGNLQVDLKK